MKAANFLGRGSSGSPSTEGRAIEGMSDPLLSDMSGGVADPGTARRAEPGPTHQVHTGLRN
ncbi:hypothetical protein GCM10010398_04810 [Streptomyces fimbriatus]